MPSLLMPTALLSTLPLLLGASPVGATESTDLTPVTEQNFAEAETAKNYRN